MIAASALISLAAFLGSVSAQQVGTYTAETHPALSWQQCTGTGSCTTQAGKITLDSNWRWTHIVGFVLVLRLREASPRLTIDFWI